MTNNLSCIDTFFAEQRIDRLTLAELLINRDEISDHVINECSRLFVKSLYPGKGSKHSAHKLIPFYKGEVYPEFEEIWIQKNANCFIAVESSQCDILKIRHYLRKYYSLHKTDEYKIINKQFETLEEYFGTVGSDLSLTTILRNRKNCKGYRFSHKANIIAANIFARHLAPHAVERYTGYISNYKGQIINQFNFVKIHKLANGSYTVYIDDTESGSRVAKILEQLSSGSKEAPISGTKVCSCCGETLPFTSFTVDHYSKDLRHPICKKCSQLKSNPFNKNVEFVKIEDTAPNKLIIEPSTEITAATTVESITEQEVQQETIINIDPIVVSTSESPDKYLKDCSIDEIIGELKSRGYTGELIFKF